MSESQFENLLAIARNTSFKIRDALVAELKQTGYIGDQHLNPGDLKSSHRCDDIAAGIIKAEIDLSAFKVHLESYESLAESEGEEGSFYVDPVDGSANWDRGVGDPCVVIAWSPLPDIHCLNDLKFAYVLGLRSGVEFYTDEYASWYVDPLTGSRTRIGTQSTTLDQATAYLRPGYGGAEAFIAKANGLLPKVRDIRGFDNSGIEWCELARGACHLVLEVRGISDGFNLIAWPILQKAGGVLVDLEGNDLPSVQIDLHENHDYVAAASATLAGEVIRGLV